MSLDALISLMEGVYLTIEDGLELVEFIVTCIV